MRVAHTKELLLKKETSQKSFDAVIALGKNWRLPINSKSKIHLSIESKMTALAAAELYVSGRARSIIFSTGHTAGYDAQGRQYPTEAEEMYLFLRRHFSSEVIPDSAIILEQHSFDTAGNAQEVQKLLAGKNSVQSIALLTVGFHVPRSKKIFANYGYSISKVFSSQQILRDRNTKYQTFTRKYWFSKRHFREIGRETIGLGLVHTVDPKGTILRKLTIKTRNRQEREEYERS